MSHTGTVQEIYGAFGRGDVPAILANLADDVEWDDDASGAAPFLVPRRGKGEVGGFFEALQAAEFTQFQPTTFLESGSIVVVLLDVTFTVKATGKTVHMPDEVHIWRFNDGGTVQSFRHRVDTHAHVQAFAQ